MNSIDLVRDNLAKSSERVLAKIEEMREHCGVPPTSNGGGHTLWVLGHLAYIEALVVRTFMLGEPNPLAEWESLFDGDGVDPDPSNYPPFDEVLAKCREMRAATIELAGKLSEEDLDREGTGAPQGHEEMFGTYRLCLQFLADHWYMHRGQLACARRSSQIDRMWF